MSTHLGFIPLDTVVTDFLGEAKSNQKAYLRMWNIVFRGMEKLGIDSFYKTLSVKLSINANLTVTLPADYQQWTKVGVLNSKGEIIPLDNNDKLTTYADLSPDRIEKTQDATLGAADNGNIYWYNYWNGYSYTNVYGVPSGSPFVGSFKVDTNNGVILLNPDFQYDYLMLEYRASPQPGGEYYIPVEFREALIAWMIWRDNISIPAKTHVANSNIQMRRHDFFEARRLAIAAYKPLRISEAYQSSQEMTRLTVRS